MMHHSTCSVAGNLRLVGDPVDVVSGVVTDLRADFRRRGPIPLDWNRYYSSANAQVDGYTGFGFQHEYERWLARDLDGIRYHSPDVGFIPFQEIEIGALDQSMGLLLHRSEPTLYTVHAADGLRYSFRFLDNTEKAALVKIEDADEHCIEFLYDHDGRLEFIVDSLNRTIAVKWNENGRIESLVLQSSRHAAGESLLIRYEYDKFGNAIRVTDLYDTVQSFEFDRQHRLVKRTDRLGYSFLFTYDSEGRCIHARGEDNFMSVRLEYNPDARTTYVERADGGRWAYFYSPEKHITQINDPYGNATKYQVDSLGRTVAEIDPLGNTTQWHYNSFGVLDYRIGPSGNILPAQPESAEPPLVHGYTIPTNPLEWEFGRLLTPSLIAPANPSDTVLQQVPSSVFNACLGIRDSANSARESSIDGSSVDIEEDDYDRPLDGSDGIEHWKYDASGNEIEHRDRDGRIVRRVYASASLPREEIDPLGNVTRFQQTYEGLASRVEDPGGTAIEYMYDLCDRIVEIRQNGKTAERYVRDSVGNITDKFDGQGNRLVEWTYGPGNLFTERILASGEKHQFKYDEFGRIVSAKTPSGTATLQYHFDDSVTEDKRDGLGVAHAMNGSVVQQTLYLDKFMVEYGWNNEGDWVITDPTGSQHRIRISENGLVLKQLANGKREFCQYDSEGRCLRKANFANGETSPWMRQYQYTLAGDLVSIRDTNRGQTSIQFDEAHRLRRVSGAKQSIDYRYDAAGNLIQQGEQRAAYGDRNRLVAFGDEGIEYDNQDRIAVRKGTATEHCYSYNELGLLTNAQINGQPWKAEYDAFCRRTSKTWQGQKTQYYWDDLRLAAEVHHDGSLRLYIYVDHKALVPFMTLDYQSLDAEPNAGVATYLVTDQIGTPIQAESERGQVRWSGESAAFGTANVSSEDGHAQPIRFPGHYADDETGLHYNRFRYYSPEFGRYLQPDPLGQLGGINLYTYSASLFVAVDIDGLAANKRKSTPQKKPEKPPEPQQAKPTTGPQASEPPENAQSQPCPSEPIQGSGGPGMVYEIPAEELKTNKPYIGKTKQATVADRMADKDHREKTPTGDPPKAKVLAENLTDEEMAGVEAILIQQRGLDNLSNKIPGLNPEKPKNAKRLEAGRKVLGQKKK
jgi:RHS repeat-associated protein